MKKVIGLTGGIATGKSAVSSILRDLGYFVIDADAVVHELQEPGQALNLALRQLFAAKFFDEEGNLKRQELGQLIFRDKEANKRLSELTQGLVRPELLKRRDASQENLIFMDIPLLFEQNYEKEVDEIWLVTVPEDLQLSRLMARSKLSLSEAKARIASQMPLSEKIKKSDLILDNSGNLIQLKNAIEKQLQQLSSGAV